MTKLKAQYLFYINCKSWTIWLSNCFILYITTNQFI